MKILKLALLVFFHSTSLFAANSHHHMSTSIGGGGGIFGSIFSFSTGSGNHNPPPPPMPGYSYKNETPKGLHLSSYRGTINDLKYRQWNIKRESEAYVKQVNDDIQDAKNYGFQNGQSFDNKQKWQERYVQRMQEPELLEKAQQSFETKLKSYKSTHPYDFLPDSQFIYVYSENYFKHGYYQEAQFYLELARDLLDVATSVTPGVSVGRDSYEAYTGKNLITGAPLSHFDRGLAVVGVVTAGGSNMGVKGISAINKIAGVNLTKETVTISQDILKKYGMEGYKEIVSLLKKHTPSIDKYEEFNRKRRAVFASFSDLTDFKKKGFSVDTTLYRYIKIENLKYTDRGAHWFTSHKYDTMEELAEKLALPAESISSKMFRTEFTVKAGEPFMKGGIAPNFGRTGGGDQYYFFDKTKTAFKKGSEFEMK